LSPTSATQHPYHFEDLSADEFERLVYWLVKRSDEFDEVQQYGGARDKGRDVVGYKHTAAGREKWYIQCKRYEKIAFPTLREELKKLADHTKADPGFAPDVVVFATACPVPAQAKDKAKARARELGLPEPYYWGRWELDERLKGQPGTAEEFFLPTGVRRPYIPEIPPAPEILPEPGKLPPGYRLPFTRNALFTGREDRLKDLARALLHDQSPSALVTQAVAGMGGVGKTQLVVEFVYRYGRFFHGVHWLNAGSPAGLGAEVAACGAAMGLKPWPEKRPEQVARTLEAWRRGGARLVVLDNLEAVDPAREWLGRLSGGGVRVLVTARRQDWPRDLGLDPLRLEVFSEGESLEFLREYLGEGRATDAELDRLAERLGHLPLALELAGRYLESPSRLRVDEYVEKIEEIYAHPSMADWKKKLGSPTGHDLDLAKTFAASWDRVEDEVACRVFLMVGWCAPNQPVPCEVLEKAADLDTERCDEAVGVLAGLGLVEVEDPQAGPLVHPLLGEFARALADAGETLPALVGALRSLAGEAIDTELPQRFTPLRSHLETVAPAAELAELEQAGSLWNALGRQLRRLADYASARTALERALGIDEQVYGPEHPKVARDVNNLGGVLRDQGDLAGARECYERALGIDERVYGPEHPKVAIRVNNLGRVLRAEGDLVGARECYERTLGIDERVYGLEHPKVAIRINNLGMVLKDQGDLVGARGCYERALGIDERVYGPEHPKVAIRVNNLGRVLRAQGDLTGARECFERALEIREKFLPEGHPSIEMVRRNLESLGK